MTNSIGAKHISVTSSENGQYYQLLIPPRLAVIMLSLLCLSFCVSVTNICQKIDDKFNKKF